MTRWIAVILLGVFAGCRSGGLQAGVFSKDGVRYALAPPETGWKPVSVDDNDLAWVSREDGKYSLAVDSTCAPNEDAPLEILTNHLLMDFTEREKLSQTLESLDGREALRSRFRAKLDGVLLELEFVVMKKDGCVYDFTYIAPPGQADDKRADFDRLVHGFKTEPTS